MSRAAAGRKAEEQMAFYLHRHFHDDKNTHVLNDIRLERKGEIAQIDHLVIHPHGIVIVESKSVSTTVRVNLHDEWDRQHGSSWRGMPSPVLQARRQGKLLHHLLQDNARELLGTLLLTNIPEGFGAMALDVFVAVSDSGRIQRQKPDLAPEATKADQVPHKIQSLMRKYSRSGRLLSLNAPRAFSVPQRQAMASFLLANNKPLRIAPAPADTSEDSTPAVLGCPACKSIRTIDWNRKASYHFNCGSCGTTETIRVTCTKCNQAARISKAGPNYSISCRACNINTPYLTVPA
jgi:hypothetical protein